MLPHFLEPAWVDAFEAVLSRCALRPGDTVAILAETQTRPELPELARMAAARMGCQAFQLVVTTPFEPGPAVRSTGASTALQQIAPVVAALAGSTLVVDCTVEGLMHAPELPAILKGGARVIYVSNEHPEALARLVPGDSIKAVDDDPVTGFVSLSAALHKTKPGQTVRLKIVRNGQQMELPATLSRRPLEVIRPETGAPPSFLVALWQIDDQTAAAGEGAADAPKAAAAANAGGDIERELLPRINELVRHGDWEIVQFWRAK